MKLVDLLDNSWLGPPVVLGAMFWGSDVPQAMAHRILDAAADRDAAIVDTSNNYIFWGPSGLGGESESCIGDWLAERGPAARDKLVLATKLGARPSRPGGGLTDTLGLGADAIAEQLRSSLQRLRTDHVDLVYTHIDDTSVPLAETLGALQQLVHDGLTRGIAASNLTAARLTESLAAAGDGEHYCAVQNRFTYLRPRPGIDIAPQVVLDDEVIDAGRPADVAMIGYSTLLSGAYTRADRDIPGDYRHDRTEAALAVLRATADEVGLDPGQLVLAWMSQRSAAVIPIVGLSRVEQLDGALQAVSTELAPDTVRALDQARAHPTNEGEGDTGATDTDR